MESRSVRQANNAKPIYGKSKKRFVKRDRGHWKAVLPKSTGSNGNIPRRIKEVMYSNKKLQKKKGKEGYSWIEEGWKAICPGYVFRMLGRERCSRLERKGLGKKAARRT